MVAQLSEGFAKPSATILGDSRATFRYNPMFQIASNLELHQVANSSSARSLVNLSELSWGRLLGLGLGQHRTPWTAGERQRLLFGLPVREPGSRIADITC